MTATDAHDPDDRLLSLLDRCLADPAADPAGLCGGDTELLVRLRQALAAMNRFAVTDPAADPPPQAVPGFDLLGEVGRGGMGVVYRARDRSLGRDVALKLLAGRYPADGAAARRFLAEARITGQLQHPGIPPVHEVGELADGRPFLAMKLIRGETLDVLLKRDASLDPLGVFQAVAQTVGYAHAHGVVHRDLKPANIMVGAFGEVQVMDWGLAKVLTGPAPGELPATGVPAAGPALPPSAPAAGVPAADVRPAGDDRTRLGSVLGTPAYMAPEQARGDVAGVGRRTDVFGLGAVLCTILTGRPPYAGADAGSTLQLAAAGDLTDAHARLAGCGAEPGLVALCRRCLAPVPALRPADAGEVAHAVADLRAAADDRARQAEVERERAAVREAEGQKRRRLLTAAAAGLAVAAGLAGWQAVRATAARDAEAAQRSTAELRTSEAEDERANARRAEAAAVADRGRAEAKADEAAAVNAFLLDDLLKQASGQAQTEAGHAPNPNLTVREALNRAADRVGGRFRGRPALEEVVRGMVGDAYRGVGEFDRAADQGRRVLESRRARLGAAHPDTLSAVSSLAVVHLERGDHPAAEPLLKEALDGFRAVHGPDHTNALQAANNLAGLYKNRGDLAAAERLLGEVLDARRRSLGGGHALTLQGMNNLAAVLQARGDQAAAEPLLVEALAGRRQALGPAHPDTLTTANNLALTYRYRGRYSAAEELFRGTLAAARTALGPAHPLTLSLASNLGGLYVHRDNPAAAEPLYREVLDARRRTLGPTHPATLRSASNLSLVCQARGDLKAAQSLLAEALAGQRKALGPAHPDTLTAVANLGGVFEARGDYPAAERLYRESQAGCREALGPLHPDTLDATISLAGLYRTWGRAEAAEAAFREALAGQRKALGPAHPDTLATVGNLAVLYSDAGRHAEAVPLLRETLGGYERRTDGAGSAVAARSTLGLALLALGRHAEAEPLLLAGYAAVTARASPGPDDRNRTRRLAAGLAALCGATGRPAEAAAWRAKLAALPPEAAPPPRPAG